ncbi:MAG: hypothetical protein K2L51_04870, partial [Clostridiales bacterium]|nr:hypothetical protein [Clostridiales bacterium]
MDKLDEGKLSVTAAYEYNWIFFRNAYAENFAVETFIEPGDYFLDIDNDIVYDTNGLINYRDGHAGFYFLTDTGLEYVPRLSLNSMKENTDNVLAEFNLSTLDNIISSHNASGSKASMPNNSNDPGVWFKTVKYGADLLYFANGEFLYAESVPALNSKLYVGLYNITRSATYKSYSFTEYNADQAEKAIADADICTVQTSARTGGRIICNDKYVPKNGKTTVEVLCNSGYALEKVTLNSVDITDDFKRDAVDGKYTVTVNEDAQIAATFARIPAEQLADVSGVVYSADRAAAATLKFVSDTDASAAYSVNATSSRGYSVQLPKGQYTVYITYGLTAGLARKVNVTQSGTYDIHSYAYRNANMTYTVDETAIVAYNPTPGPNYAMFIREASNEFVASAKFTAVQASFPAAGFTVEDEDGHSLQFQVIDNGTSTTFRLHVDMKWYDFKMEKGVSELFRAENGAKVCTVKLVSSNDMFAFYMNDKLVLGVTVDEINAYINANIFKDVQTYFHKGKYAVGVFSWEVKAADNRTSDEPIVKVTDYSFTSEFATGHSVNVTFSFFGENETVTAKYGEGLAKMPSFGLNPNFPQMPYDILLNGAKVQLTEDLFTHLLCDSVVEYVPKNSMGLSYNKSSGKLTNNAQSRFDIGTANGYFTANANITNNVITACPGIIVEDAWGNKLMFGFANTGNLRLMKSHSSDWSSSWNFDDKVEGEWKGGASVNEAYGLGLVYDAAGFSLWV